MLPLVYHSNYSCPFPDNHRFVMSKFVRLHDYCQAQGLIRHNLFRPQTASCDDLSIAHAPQHGMACHLAGVTPS